MSQSAKRLVIADECSPSVRPLSPLNEDQFELDLALSMPEIYPIRYADQRVPHRPRLPIAEAARDSLELYREPGRNIRRRSRGFSERLADLGRKARDSIIMFLGRSSSGSRRESIFEAYELAGSTRCASIRQSDEVAVYSSSGERSSKEQQHGRPNERAKPDLPNDQDRETQENFERLAAAVENAANHGEYSDVVRDARFQTIPYRTSEEEQWDASYDFGAMVANRRRFMDDCYKEGRDCPDKVHEDVELSLLPFSIGSSSS